MKNLFLTNNVISRDLTFNDFSGEILSKKSMLHIIGGDGGDEVLPNPPPPKP